VEREIWNRRKSGEIYPQWQTICAIRDDEVSSAITWRCSATSARSSILSRNWPTWPTTTR
jgi:hypothetical protein